MSDIAPEHSTTTETREIPNDPLEVFSESRWVCTCGRRGRWVHNSSPGSVSRLGNQHATTHRGG